MKSICFCFEVHQPLRFRKYRFFDIGNDHYYYDDYTNEAFMHDTAELSYIPANKILLELIKKYKGLFKVSFSITGTAIEQFSLYAPEVLKSFKKLAKTGQVEFLSETYSHTLASVKNEELFAEQIKRHDELIKKYFDVKPVVFKNTELIYNDRIGEIVAKMGFKGMLTEGAKHILGWKSPDFLYCNVINPRLKVLLRNVSLSDDLSYRFSNKNWNKYPLTAEKFVNWMNADEKAEIINLFINYDSLGKRQPASSGIFDFFKKLPEVSLNSGKLKFATPSEIIKEYQPVSSVHVPNTISWADEEKDMAAWLGNEMQDEAFNKLYALSDKMKMVEDKDLIRDWDYLQTSDHFYYMCTKVFSDGEIHDAFNPYESPYDAFINYMNVLNDFTLRLNAVVPESNAERIKNLERLLEEKDSELYKYSMEFKEKENKI